jgi:uncharacterized protein (DUF488 family)
MTVFTIGYEQSDPVSFLRLLKLHKIDLIVDVRQIPLSRKKGFSKNQLKQMLAKGGIDYFHMQALGAPKVIRDRLRNSGSWHEYVRSYLKVLETKEEEVLTLFQFAQRQSICLLCFERRPEECHRSLITRDMEARKNGLAVYIEHIRY